MEILCKIVIVSSAILTAYFLVRLLLVPIEAELERRRLFPERKETLSIRDAFNLEVTPDMLKNDPNARRLDKAIKRIERSEKRIKLKRNRYDKIKMNWKEN